MVKQRLVLEPHQIAEIKNLAIATLTLAQQNYLYKVLRLKSGAEFTALDGRGTWWRAVLAKDVGVAQILAQISSDDFKAGDLALDVTLAIAMPKQGMEDVIRQATELGVRRIMPLWSDRTVVRPNTPIGTAKFARWVKITQEISEQSHRAYIPQIDEPQTLMAALTELAPHSQPHTYKYIGVTTKPTPHLLDSLLNSCRLLQPLSVVMLTGAEGGWTETEAAMAIANDFQPVSLGDRVLAAVTAPVVALSIIAAISESQFNFYK